MPASFDPTRQAPAGPRARWPAWLALAAACVVGVLFAVRTIAAEDLGYHLAYGRRFLDTGRFVDHDPGIYTTTTSAVPVAAAAPEPGPGCWYDDEGRYRFANANWLTQVLVAAAYRAGGVPALNGLLAVLAMALFALVATLFRRLETPVALAAAGVLLIALLACTRVTLRPELVGYVVLTAQACLLAGRASLTMPRVVGLLTLQVVFVNLHSYFFLGLALTTAALVGGGATPRRRLGWLLAGQGLACLVNPWTWRGAVLPFETMLFLRANDISSGPGAHPWTSMADMRRAQVFGDGWWHDPVALAFHAALVVAVVGLAAAIRTRRWAWALTIAGMTLVAFSAERNVAVGMLVAMPFALAALGAAVRGTRWPSIPRRFHLPATCALIAASLVTSGLVITNRMYTAAGMPVRFGRGLSRVHLPVGAAEWLSGRELEGRIWAAPAASSTIYGFVEPAPQLNMVTNTWAYPPDVMRDVLAASCSYDERVFGPTADRWNVGVVVAEPGRFLRQLVREGEWTAVHVEGRFVVLVRTGGPDALHIAGSTMPTDPAGATRLVDATRRLDPVPGTALRETARVLIDLQRFGLAHRLLAASREDAPDVAATWAETARAFEGQALNRLIRNPGEGREALELAAVAMRRAHELDDDPQLRENLAGIERALAAVDARATAE